MTPAHSTVNSVSADSVMTSCDIAASQLRYSEFKFTDLFTSQQNSRVCSVYSDVFVTSFCASVRRDEYKKNGRPNRITFINAPTWEG